MSCLKGLKIFKMENCEVQSLNKIQTSFIFCITSFIFSDHLIQSTHERKFLALNLMAVLISRVSSDRVTVY